MNKKFKRALSSILAFILVVSTLTVMNVSSVFAADTYTFTPSTSLYSTDDDGNNYIASGTTLTFTNGSDYITATTGPKASQVSTDSNYSFTSSPTAVIAFRASGTISSQVTSYADYVNSSVYYTYAVLNPKVTGTLTAEIGINASSSSRTVRLFDNTDVKEVVNWSTGANGKKVYTIGGTASQFDSISNKNDYTLADTSTGTLTLTANHQYILYMTGTAAQLGQMTFTPASTDPDITVDTTSVNIAVGSSSDTITASTANAGDAEISWESANPDVAAVSASTGSSVTITGVAAGETTVTASITVDEKEYTANVAVTVYEVTIDDTTALTATAPTYTGDYTTITTNEDGSVTYSYNFAALAQDAIDADLNPAAYTDDDGNEVKAVNSNFTLSNGVLTGGTYDDLDGDCLYMLSTVENNLQVVGGSDIAEVKFANAATGLTFAIGNNCTASIAITKGTSGGTAVLTNTDSNEVVTSSLTSLDSLESGNYSITRSSSLFITKLEITVSAVEEETTDYFYAYFTADEVSDSNNLSFSLYDSEGNLVTGTDGKSEFDTVYTGVDTDGDNTADVLPMEGYDYIVAFVVSGANGATDIQDHFTYDFNTAE
ncbi:MAG: hypothetical protein LUG66_05280 [Clostridiales bacterium]|nr:hypothetical protein [Clostridiales bacterium]